MMKLARWFEIQFSDKDFSIAELLDFSQDHLGRLATQNTDDRYDEMLTATTTAYEGLGGTVSNETTAQAVQKARTNAKVSHLKAILERVRRLSGSVVGTFGQDSSEYLEFFPQGLKDWNAARESEITGLLNRVIAAAGTHLPAMTAELTALKTTWITLLAAASGGRAATTAKGEARATAVAALQLQLTKNLLDIAREFVGQPNKANDFFDESRLYNRTLNGPDQPPPDPPPPPVPLPPAPSP